MSPGMQPKFTLMELRDFLEEHDYDVGRIYDRGDRYTAEIRKIAEIEAPDTPYHLKMFRKDRPLNPALLEKH